MTGRTGGAIAVRLCPSVGYDEAIRRLVPKESVVIAGGRRRRWWPTREQRLAERLRRTGHDTIFAEVTPAPRRPDDAAASP